MEINLHFLPEVPNESCDVVGFHYNIQTGDIYLVMSTSYSTKYKMFCAYDGMSEKTFEERKENIQSYSDGIIAWAYMSEVVNEVFDEING